MDKVMVQQGDCILVKVASIPKEAKKIAFKGIVLKGEGANTHEIAPDEVEVYDQDGIMYLKVDKETKLIHQEHGTQKLDKGLYKRVIEREFDYYEQEARQVRD